MTDETGIDTYPTVREALFGNGHVANIRCAIKWLLWQTSYVLLAIGMLLLKILVVIPARAFGLLTQTSVGERTVNAIERALQSSVATKISRAIGIVSLVFVVAVAVGTLVLILLHNPTAILAGIAAAITVFGVIAFTLYALYRTYDARRSASETIGTALQRAGETAVQTPGVRRVYGKCPVHWDIEPKWFRKL